MKYLACLLVLPALVAACAANGDPAGDARECDAPPESAETNPEETEARPEQPEAKTRGEREAPGAPEQARAQRLIEDVTGLKFLHDVPVYLYTPEELEAEVRSWGDGFTPDNILGFYNPSTKAIYLVPEAAGNERAFGLRVHESCHALQDQHWGLRKLREGIADSDDKWAVRGLIEGHAVQVMIDALKDEQPRVRFIAQAAAPEGSTDPRQYRSVYTYAQGTRFIQHLKENGGYERVHKAFESPPVSSEQILHPEKYADDYDPPDGVKLDLNAIEHRLPEGWRLLEPDTLGEFETRMVFVRHEETVQNAEEAAGGWGGDRVVQAFREDRKITLWATAWDTADDAAEFAGAAAGLPDTTDVYRDENLAPRLVYVLQSQAPLNAETRRDLMEALRNTQFNLDPR